ncbi:MAG: acyl-CoA reductase [Chloroflexota bacterium]
MDDFPGYWLPKAIEQALITPQTVFTRRRFAGGRPADGESGAVSACWPVFSAGEWTRLLDMLQEQRRSAPSGMAYWERFNRALPAAGALLADPHGPYYQAGMAALPGYTGYSQAMIRAALHAPANFALPGTLPAFSSEAPAGGAAGKLEAHGWRAIPGQPGYIYFHAASAMHRAAALLENTIPGLARSMLFSPPNLPELVVGYGSGNVPGAALLVTLLAWGSSLLGGGMPAVLARNSRREPLFTPLVLRAIEQVDPGLACATAVLTWDYEDAALQARVLEQADLVVAAASDETIRQLQGQVDAAQRSRSRRRPPLRLHAHGHKVSFAAIGRDVLERGGRLPGGRLLLPAVALLAGLDSAFWDQFGCLSARVHFVEEGGAGQHTPAEYAAALAGQLARLAERLPRGAWPRRQLQDRFDRFKALEAGGQVQVFSRYEDEFVVALDRRTLDGEAFRQLVNDCQGRTVIVRPVAALDQIPGLLRLIPPANLQSLSVALGRPGQAVDRALLRFARACADCGVTAIRSAGRGAFPQPAYSWDGYIPLDLLCERPAGRFSTIEFDAPFDQLEGTLEIMEELLEG